MRSTVLSLQRGGGRWWSTQLLRAPHKRATNAAASTRGKAASAAAAAAGTSSSPSSSAAMTLNTLVPSAAIQKQSHAVATSSPSSSSSTVAAHGKRGAASSGEATHASAKTRLVTPPVASSAEEAAEALMMLQSTAPSASGAGVDGGSPAAAQPLPLTNPFCGMHTLLSRSYRLEPLLEASVPGDVLLARQEKKSTAFSFLRFQASPTLYERHWSTLPALAEQQAALLRRGPDGTSTPGFTLFNNNLGLDNPRVQSSMPLIIAQRLLLFPDQMRHFHALCGRELVPCDFFADVDLPNETPESGEQVLLEILNYLEVRLPGIGFTDPLFMVLSNDTPSKDKVSYHIHARSMTYAKERMALVLNEAADSLEAAVSGKGKTSRRKNSNKRKGKNGTATNKQGEEEEEEEADADDYDDLSDLVNVVDADGTAAAKAKKSKNASTKIIAFQDYRTVKLVADEVNQTLGRSVIDENCYRAHGMLRCVFSSKLQSSQDIDYRAGSSMNGKRRLMPLLTASDPALQRKLTEMEDVLRTMTDPEVLELSFCTRHLDDVETTRLVHHHLKETLPSATRGAQRKANDDLLKAATRHRFKLLRPRHVLGPQGSQAVEYDAYGNVVSPYLTEAAKWRRYKAAVTKLHTMPPRSAESYDVWVRVGLALHNFSNEDHVFEEWVKFSLKCPQKYSREACRKKWIQFERNPDALNWRRGFNYLNTTVWRTVS